MMSEHLYLLSMAALFGTPILIFGMKYFSAARQAQARLLEEGAYRDLAAKAVAAQTANGVSLGAVQADLTEIKTRLTAIEKILKAVE